MDHFAMNPRSISAVFDHLDRELWLITAGSGARRGGLIATFVSSASIVPEMPRVLVGLANRHYTRELVEASGAMALHVIDESRLDWVWRFGLGSGRGRDKLEGVAHRVGATGSPILDGVVGWLEARVEDRLDTGDRTIYLGAIVDGRLESDRPALTLRRMIALAPPDRRRALVDQMARDRALDAEAIRAWRDRRAGP